MDWRLQKRRETKEQPCCAYAVKRIKVTPTWNYGIKKKCIFVFPNELHKSCLSIFTVITHTQWYCSCMWRLWLHVRTDNSFSLISAFILLKAYNLKFTLQIYTCMKLADFSTTSKIRRSKWIFSYISRIKCVRF